MAKPEDRSVGCDQNLISDQEMKKTFNYVVDYIAAKRVNTSGKVEYLVKWEGWHPRQSTWETVDQFASPQVADIFERGVRAQCGGGSTQEANEKHSSAAVTKTNAKSSAHKSSRKSRPLATKFIDDMRRKGPKNSRKTKATITEMDDNRMEVLHVIKTYEKLIGAPKRKSRMSCPSTPPKVTRHESEANSAPPKGTLRSQRYRMREELKSQPFNDYCLSTESNGSHEENKNPLNRAKSGNNHKNRVNSNDCNKMVNDSSHNLSNTAINSAVYNVVNSDNNSAVGSMDVSESPTKQFLNRVKRTTTPTVYSDFLNEIIEFKEINAELTAMLCGSKYLLEGLIEIMENSDNSAVHWRHINDNDMADMCPKSSHSIDETAEKWKQEVNDTLTAEEAVKFWDFLDNLDRKYILKASPDTLMATIDRMFESHRDLSREFSTFAPNLTSNFYSHKSRWINE